MRAVIWLLVLVFIAAPVLAETQEARSLLQEIDITFWQTMPFAAFWGYIIDRQLIGTAATTNWNTILAASVVLSATNAYFHARQACAKK